MDSKARSDHTQAPRESPPPARPPIHVLLVDDHPAVRHGIRQLIFDQPDMTMVAEHGSASADTSAVARWANVAVIDYHLGDRDGLWLARQIKRHARPPAILIYSAFADTALAVRAIVAGADGMLAKTTLADELTIAIRRLADGRQYFPAVPGSVTGALAARLEPGDRPIFSALIDGIAPEQISSRLGIAAAELEARRELILRAIAPTAARSDRHAAPQLPLDYERPRRRPRYSTAG